jgi:hypothetical protein
MVPRELGAEKSAELGKELILQGDPADTTLTVIWLACDSPLMHARTYPEQSESKFTSVLSVQNKYVPEEASLTVAM